ncbi:MAG: hypothetical protein BZY80_02925 [SAR202 cluster bacterium Io17-Chloro-G2]|nr:MAG: hypothetical protein BZY80_02925 [SAR202 cluster bacterium Io17-Chloro-G2]
MEFVFGIGGSLVQLLVIGGIIAAVVMLVRRRSEAGEDPGIGTLKRLYFYVISFAALMASAVGAFLLVDSAGDALLGNDIFFRGQTQLALALALTIVGVPVWLFHWNLARRSVGQVPWETQALARRVYLYLVLAVSGAVAVFGFVSLFRWWLGALEFDGLHLALPIVWGVVWAFHWRQVDLEKQSHPVTDLVGPLYVYAASLAGLIMLLVGIGIMLQRLILPAYDAVFATQLLGSTTPGLWNDVMGTALAIAVNGGGFWWWHWHRAARPPRSEIATGARQVYLYIFAIFAGAATVVVSLSIVLFRLLSWAFGQQDLGGADDYFRFLPSTLSALVAGGGLWGYHWSVAQQESRAAGGLPAARGAYRYLVSAVALGALGTGLVLLVGVGAGTILPLRGEELAGTRWWSGQLALAVTLLAVGGPLWAYHWFSAQRDVAKGGREELAALSRRVFVYFVFGVAVLIVLGSVSGVLFLVLKNILEGDFSIAVLQDAKLPLGMALIAGAVGFYYWLVLQEDRRALAEISSGVQDIAPVEPRMLKNVIAVASGAAQPMIRRLEANLGAPIRLWQRLDAGEPVPSLTEEQLTDARRRIIEAPGDRVLLTLDASGITVMPYREI